MTKMIVTIIAKFSHITQVDDDIYLVYASRETTNDQIGEPTPPTWLVSVPPNRMNTLEMPITHIRYFREPNIPIDYLHPLNILCTF